MLRTLFFAFVAALLFQSCNDTPPPRTYTEADYTKFTDSLGFAIRNGDTAFLFKHFNVAQLQDNFVKNVKVGLLAEDQARELCKNEIKGILSSLSKRPDREFFKHLHTVRKGDTAVYYFRAFYKNRTEYLSVDVAPGPGHMYISDMMLFHSGMTFSEMIFDFYRAVFVDNNKIIPGNDAVRINTQQIFDQINNIQISLSEGQYSNVLSTIMQMPSAVQETITVQQYEMQACAFTGDSARAERLRKRTEGFSKIKNARCFLLYEVYFSIRNYDAALKCCDQTEEILKDPMVGLYRSVVLLQKGNFPAAEEYLLKVKPLAGNEHRQAVYLILLKVQILQNNTDKALATANEMIEVASFEKSDLYFYFMQNLEMARDPRVNKFFD